VFQFKLKLTKCDLDTVLVQLERLGRIGCVNMRSTTEDFTFDFEDEMAQHELEHMMTSGALTAIRQVPEQMNMLREGISEEPDGATGHQAPPRQHAPYGVPHRRAPGGDGHEPGRVQDAYDEQEPAAEDSSQLEDARHQPQARRSYCKSPR